MARQTRQLKLPMFGALPIVVYDAAVEFYDQLRASRKPRHRPPSLDSFVQRFYIVHAVATLKALDPRRKIRGDIAKQVARHYAVSETWVFEARRSVDPKLRAMIEAKAGEDMTYASRFADPPALTKWRERERRHTDAT